MPTLLLINGLRFFFYSNENNEPAHVHINKGNADGKIWLEPAINIAFLFGFTHAEEKDILEIITLNHETFLQRWYEYSMNKFDTIEALIYEEGLRIEAIDFHPELDIMLILLNTKAVLQQRISSYKNLLKADHTSLANYELIANGIGVHWPLLDEDLSLKGFLKDELRQIVKNNSNTVRA